jgi:hypothetical protein
MSLASKLMNKSIGECGNGSGFDMAPKMTLRNVQAAVQKPNTGNPIIVITPR